MSIVDTRVYILKKLFPIAISFDELSYNFGTRHRYVVSGVLVGEKFEEATHLNQANEFSLR